MAGPIDLNFGLYLLPSMTFYNLALTFKVLCNGIFILTRLVLLVKYSRIFVERPSQGTSSLASRLTTMSLDDISEDIAM